MCLLRSIWRMTARRQLHRFAALPEQKSCSTLLRREQVGLTLQRWLFAESIEKMTRKSNKKGKALEGFTLNDNAEQSPDFIIAGLRDIWQKRLRIRSEIFVDSILLPLESKNGSLVDLLRRSSDIHVPFLLSLCGLPMSNVTCNERAAIANRFWNAVIDANIPITIAAMKSRLRTLIENEQTFDAWEMLNEIETTFGLISDEELFTLLLQVLSMSGQVETMDSMITEIERRKLPINMNMKAAQIYCYLKKGDSDTAENLIQSVLMEHGDDGEALISKARCQDAIEKHDIEKTTMLLTAMSSPDSSFKLLTDEMAVEFVWLLARNSTDSMGKEHERLCAETLRKVKKEPGFFKLMIREAERHAVHGMFYSALSYFNNDLHIAASSSKNDLGRHTDWIDCFSQSLINADLPLKEMKALFTHIRRNVHHGHFLLERILFCMLSDRLHSSDRRLQVTLELLKILDPVRTKVHVIMPLLVRTSTNEERLKILEHFVSAGYSDLDRLNYGIIRNLVLRPLLGKGSADESKKWNIEKLSCVVDVLAKHNIAEENAYKLLESVVIGKANLQDWLKKRINRHDGSARNYGEMSPSTLKRYISNEEVEKIHEFIKNDNGLANVSLHLFQTIISLYIRKADWTTLMEFIKLICENDSETNRLTVDNILMILARHLEEYKDLNMTSDFVHQLQQIAPMDLHHSNAQNQKAARRLVQKCLELPHETVHSLISCSQLFRKITDVSWIQSGSYETVSTSFASATLNKFGFDDALKVCDSFQFSNFPNGIICLMHHTSGVGDMDLFDKAVAVAKTYWPEWKVSVTATAIMITVEKLNEANALLEKANIRWINVLQTYQLLCALHLDEAHNFHFNYLNLFSKALGYDKDDEACIRLTLDCLENCTRKDPDQAHLVNFLFRKNSVDAISLQKRLNRLR